jgi:uncharacterized protein (DUF1330 family)
MQRAVATPEGNVNAYVIANIEAIDPRSYPSQPEQAADTIRRYGGRYLVRNGKAELREGDRRLGRIIVIEFASMEQARRWYDSPEYAPVKALRLANARSEVMFVEGIPG